MRSLRQLTIFLAIVSTTSMTFAQKTKRPKPSPPSTKPPAMPLPGPYERLLTDASQAIVVTTPGWGSVDGLLQRYERSEGQWHSLGERIPIVVGKNGLAWDQLVEAPSSALKREGDGKSPAGIFTFGDAFGFAASAPELKLPYMPLSDSIECVDDASSSSYNEVVDRGQFPSPDWNSSEKMRTIPVYQHGAIINYNDQRVPGGGSCIFMHIWNGPGHGTAGCTAMDENRLKEVLQWLDPAKKPVLIQLPAQVYKDLQSSWNLP